FYPARQGGIHPFWQVGDGGQQAVEPVAHRNVIVARLDVDIARVALRRGDGEQVDEIDDRDRTAELLQRRHRIAVGRRGQRGGGAGREAQTGFSLIENGTAGRCGVHLSDG